MKWLVWLLILVNIGLFGYFRLNAQQFPSAMPGHAPLHPEKMQLLTPEQLEALPRKVEPSTGEDAPLENEAAIEAACYEWGSFTADSVSRAREALARLGLASRARVVASQDAARYWVYIPPLNSRQEAQARSDALRALGIKETFVVQEPEWRYAISLGLFKDDALATRLADDLRARGVRDVVKRQRNKESARSNLVIENVPASVAEDIGRLKPDFPSSELKRIDCE